MPSNDIEVRRATLRRHYANHRDDVISKVQERKKALRKKIPAWFQEAKESTPCADCLRSYPHFVMHFDGGLSAAKLAERGYSLERVAKEMEPYDIVCANCLAFRVHDREADQDK